MNCTAADKFAAVNVSTLIAIDCIAAGWWDIATGALDVLRDLRTASKRPPEWVKTANSDGVAQWLGLDPAAPGPVIRDVFDAVLTPGDVILLLSWRDKDAAETFERAFSPPESARLRQVQIVRDYGTFDRREAP